MIRFEDVVLRLEILVLLLFPYLLYRFTVAFDPPSRRLARIVGSATALLVVISDLIARLVHSTATLVRLAMTVVRVVILVQTAQRVRLVPTVMVAAQTA